MGGTVADVAGTEHKRGSTELMGSRLEFETLISDLSSRFINLPPGEVDGAIENALRRVCEFLGIDSRCSGNGRRGPGCDHAHPRLPLPGGPRLPEPLQRQEQFPWTGRRCGPAAWSSLLAGGVPGGGRRRPRVLPPASASSRTSASRSRWEASRPLAPWASTPLRAERDWPDAVVKRLQLVAQVFANALARKRADEALRESEERLSLAADSAEAGLWVLDYATRVFWATARTRAIFGFSPRRGRHPGALRGRRPSRRPGSRPGGHRAVRARGRRPHHRGIPDPPAGGRRALGLVSRATPSHVRRRARSADGRLHRHQRAQARRTRRSCASEARLASGAELAGLAFYEVDFGAGTMYSDDRLRDLCGVPPDGSQGLGVLEFWMEHLHPDDRPRVMELRRQMHDGEREQFSLEYRYLHPDAWRDVDPAPGRRGRRATRADAPSAPTASSAT